MKELADAQVQILLREASERLEKASVAANTTIKPQKVDPSESPKEPAAKKPDKLSVRLPQQSLRTDQAKDTAGSNWFNLPKTDVTPALKRDWQLLRMRNVLDPKHQKKALRSTLPEYSQVGEIISGPTEIYSARLTRRERRKNLFEEAVRDHDSQKFTTKYAGIQRAKTSGKKSFYEKLKLQRRKRQN